MSDWIQVVGLFDSEAKTGEILGVQPAREPRPSEAVASETTLVVLNGDSNIEVEVPVVLDFGSCGDETNVGSFQAYVDLPEGARALILQHDGAHLAQFVPDDPSAALSGESFGLAPQPGHMVGVESTPGSPSNASYTLQARPKGSAIWETLDIGLEQPETTSVDLRQFPDADLVEVRILKSSGFKTVEIDRHEVDFTK